MSRQVVRACVQQWFDPADGSSWATAGGVPDQLDKVWTSFPKTINFKAGRRLTTVDTHAQAVVYIPRQSETRESIGGEHQGWKRVAYSVVLQVFTESKQRDADTAMADVDMLADALHDRLAADHTFGQPDTVIFTAGEPDIDLLFGEPMTNKLGATEVWFQLAFTVVQWYQA